MTWQFCDNHHCPDSWHWTDLDDIAVACSYARDQVEPEGAVVSYFALNSAFASHIH